MNFPKGFLDKYYALLSKTDFEQFMKYCQKPLRKSLRVNTLKISVADFLQIAEKHSWELESIPWCETGFWIEREDKSQPLGNSVEHFQGLFYIQEASSMLPPQLLNPQQGEIVLDMAAAPGSKTTQLAAKMQNTGIIVANEPVVKRIKGLVSNLERLGAHCVVVSRKEGQWFEKNTPNFFDKILLDAPCTGEGTVRKDSKALANWSQKNIEGMAKLQKQLIRAAFSALKPGGEIVYSTCTLAPEENEEVVEYLLSEFEGKAELLPVDLIYFKKEEIKQIQSSSSCQIQSGIQSHRYSNLPLSQPLSAFQKIQNGKILDSSLKTGMTFSDRGVLSENDMLRIWPQMFDSEGFFVAKIRKKTATPAEKMERKFFVSKYKPLSRREVAIIQDYLKERFGYCKNLQDNFTLEQKNTEIYLCPQKITLVAPAVYLERKGIVLGEFLHKADGKIEFKLDHWGAMILGQEFKLNVLELDLEQTLTYLRGQDIELTASVEVELAQGKILLQYQNFPLGCGLLQKQKIKNQLPRYLVS